MPTRNVEIRCDNTAAIILATGGGSWKTKSAASQVYGIKKQVDFWYLEAYVSFNTTDQCADSFTKFLKEGQDRRRALEHLSLVDVNQWQPGGNIKAVETFGVRDRREFSSGSFGCRACRVSVPDSEFLPSFGSFTAVWREKSHHVSNVSGLATCSSLG